MRVQIALLIVFSLLLVSCEAPDRCGNGIIDQGENAHTCCMDAGCGSIAMECISNQCAVVVEPEAPIVEKAIPEYQKPAQRNYAAEYEAEQQRLAQVNTLLDPEEGVDYSSDDSSVPEGKPYGNGVYCQTDAHCAQEQEGTGIVGKCNKYEKCEYSEAECGVPDKYCPVDCKADEDIDCGYLLGEDCGGDYDCFMDAAEDCTPVQGEFEAGPQDWGGLMVEVETIYYTKEDDNECRITVIVDDVEFEYSNERLQTLTDMGYSQDEIDDLLDDEEDEAEDTLIGKSARCWIDVDDAEDVLEEWVEDSWTLEDLEDYDCEGSLLNGEFEKTLCIAEENGECPIGCSMENDGDCDNMIAETLDCGGDYQCLIDAAKTCERATAVWVVGPYDIFGVMPTTTAQYDLVEVEDDTKCQLMTKNLDYDLYYSESRIQDLLDEGHTMQEIEEMEAETLATSQELFIGKEGWCIFDRDELSETLEFWSLGGISTSSFDNAECGGELYSGYT